MAGVPTAGMGSGLMASIHHPSSLSRFFLGFFCLLFPDRLGTSLIISVVDMLLLRMPAKRWKAKAGVMWLEGWPGMQLLFGERRLCL